MVQLDFLAHADFSGNLRKTKRSPGYGAFVSQVEALRSQNPGGTLFLDAGDEFSTTFWGGLPMVEAANRSGTDVMVLGNHEFDHGSEYLHSCIDAARFPILCSNVTERATGELIAGTVPYVILERQGVKIGVLGITTEYTPYMVTAASFAPFEIHSCTEACRKYIPEMRQAGAQVVVLLAHIPFYVDDDGTPSGELVDILRDIPPVDVCMGGHIPGDFAGKVNGAVLMKGGFAGKSLCHARVLFDAEAGRVAESEGEVILTDWGIPRQETWLAYEREVTAPFDDFFEKPLATTDEDWVLHLSSETRLGNFLSQCVQEAAGTDFAYMNATSGGGKIEAGTVTADDITAVMGFNDPILSSKMTGAQIWQLFELVYAPERFGNNAGLIFSGVVLHIDHTRPSPHKVLAVTLPDGTPLDPEREYTVATSEYMASGGNDTALVASALEWTPIGTRVYDAIFDAIKAHGELHVTPEQRIHEIGRPENDNSPF